MKLVKDPLIEHRTKEKTQVHKVSYSTWPWLIKVWQLPNKSIILRVVFFHVTNVFTCVCVYVCVFVCVTVCVCMCVLIMCTWVWLWGTISSTVSLIKCIVTPSKCNPVVSHRHSSAWSTYNNSFQNLAILCHSKAMQMKPVNQNRDTGMIV